MGKSKNILNTIPTCDDLLYVNIIRITLIQREKNTHRQNKNKILTVLFLFGYY